MLEGTALVFGDLLAALDPADFDRYMLIVYVAAVAGTVFGAWLAFRIVATLPEPEDTGDCYNASM